MSYKVGTVLSRKKPLKDDYDLVRVKGTSPIKDDSDADWVGSTNSLLVEPHETFGQVLPISVARANEEYSIVSEPDDALEVNQAENRRLGELGVTPEQAFATEQRVQKAVEKDTAPVEPVAPVAPEADEPAAG